MALLYRHVSHRKSGLCEPLAPARSGSLGTWAHSISLYALISTYSIDIPEGGFFLPASSRALTTLPALVNVTHHHPYSSCLLSSHRHCLAFSLGRKRERESSLLCSTFFMWLKLPKLVQHNRTTPQLVSHTNAADPPNGSTAAVINCHAEISSSKRIPHPGHIFYIATTDRRSTTSAIGYPTDTA